ncbi:hypothetical protein DL96DRAFT_837902 [Flagelloscypha sp. PMI_526]|nr:hypothetical protein DL96DRAFT_837902 [Flagelloscypha sp. PMI_526]
MATFTRLNRDVLFLVFVIVHDTSRPTLFSLIRINRLFHDIGLSLVYRRYTFDLKATLNNILPINQDIFFRSARTLIIRVNHFYLTWVSYFAELMPRFTHLIEVVFDGCEPIPLFLLQALETHHPSTHLHIINWSRSARNAKVGDPDEEALARTPLLRSLSANIGIASGHDFCKAALQRIAALSPNLETLELILPDSHIGLPASPFSPSPSKEVLRFQVQNPVKKTLKSLQWDYMDLTQLKSLERWLNLPGLTSLHVFMFDSSKTLTYATENHIFSGLRRLAMALPRVVLNEDGDIMSRFVASLNSLEAISLDSCPNLHPLMDTISFHHGHSLRLLRVHNAEISRGTRPTLSFDQLKTYQRRLEHLEALSIDINRSETGQNETQIYSVLSTFSHIKILTIQYDLAITHSPDFGADFCETFARDVWMFVAQPRLIELRLILGEPPRERRERQNQATLPPGYWKKQDKYVVQKIIVHRVEGTLQVTIEGARSSQMYRVHRVRRPGSQGLFFEDELVHEDLLVPDDDEDI